MNAYKRQESKSISLVLEINEQVHGIYASQKDLPNSFPLFDVPSNGGLEREREMEMVQMEWSETPWGSGKMMIEQAKEELQILEAQHPNRFEYLKLELKSFITLLQSQNPLLLSNHYNSSSSVVSSSSTATTQASSTGKKRKKGSSEMLRPESGGKIDQSKRRIQRANCDDSSNGRRRDRVEVVIERAQACLHKIQQFKTSF